MTTRIRQLVTVLVACVVIAVPLGAEASASSALYSYVTAFIDSLDYANEGLRATQEASAAFAGCGTDVFGCSAEFMIGLKKGLVKYQRAAQLLTPYRVSGDEVVKRSADTAVLVYAKLYEVDRLFLDELTTVLDGRAIGGAGTLLDRLSDLVTQEREAWKALPAVSVLVSYALVVIPDSAEGRASRLALTRTERHDLLRRLEGAFGPAVKYGTRAVQDTPMAAGALLYGLLADTRWKSLDTP